MAGGPLTIFDKSALQTLSPDEAVWLEMYFQTAITPLFYVETLADLEKKGGERPGVKIIGELANKTPSDIVPNVHHKQLILHELAGNFLEMDGRPVVGGGEVRKTPDGRIGVVFEDFPERAALDRWQREEFEEIERSAAKNWRRELAEQDPGLKIGILKNIAPTSTRLNSLEKIKELGDEFCSQGIQENLSLMLEILEIDPRMRPPVVRRWIAAGKPPLIEFAPYACHVFKVDLVYYLGVQGGFIAAERASNKADMAYLYYLPFAMMFITGDRLQLRTAPLFMDSDRSLVNAAELKVALKEMDEYHDQLPDEVKQRGVMAFASYPPSAMDNLVTQLWDKHMRPDWRDIQKRKEEGQPDNDGVPSDEIVKKLMQQIEESQPIDSSGKLIASNSDLDSMTIRRKMYVHRGKWRMVSKEVEASDKRSSQKKPKDPGAAP